MNLYTGSSLYIISFTSFQIYLICHQVFHRGQQQPVSLLLVIHPFAGPYYLTFSLNFFSINILYVIFLDNAVRIDELDVTRPSNGKESTQQDEHAGNYMYYFILHRFFFCRDAQYICTTSPYLFHFQKYRNLLV